MLLIGLDRVIVAANDASAPLFGRSPDSLVGMSWRAVLDDPDEAVGDEEWRAELVAGESFGRRRIRRPDGSVRAIDYAARAFRARGTVLVLGVCLKQRPARASPPPP